MFWDITSRPTKFHELGISRTKVRQGAPNMYSYGTSKRTTSNRIKDLKLQNNINPSVPGGKKKVTHT